MKKALGVLTGALALVAVMALPGCGSGNDDSGGNGDGDAPQVTRLRFSGIPDTGAEQLRTQYTALTEYLSNELGIPVEFEIVEDYQATIAGLASNKFDVVWLGGETTVFAEEQTRGNVTLVASRAEDTAFKTYFIANRRFVEDGTFTPVSSHEASSNTAALAALKPKFAGRSFTFGSKNSTSGHLMPRLYMDDAGVQPERDFARAGYQATGSHGAVLQAVASGQTDVGALNFINWDRASDEVKANAPVIYVTPTYMNYCLVAHNRIGAEMIEKLRAAMLKLDPTNPAHKPVMDAFGARTRWVKVESSDYEGVRKAINDARAAGHLE